VSLQVSILPASGKGVTLEDEIGRLPLIKTKAQALKEIYKIANDSRHHVLLDDENKWLETKMRVIRMLVRRGITCRKEAPNDRAVD
jgi:hypothetical protein